MKKVKKLLIGLLSTTMLLGMFVGVKADTYTDKYSPAIGWSSSTGSLKYYGTARFNMTTGKYYSNANMKYFDSAGGAVVTYTGKSGSGSSITVYGNASSPYNYTNSVSRIVSTSSSSYAPG